MRFVEQDAREWYPSTTGPRLPTMTHSLLAPGWEVLHKRYHTGELLAAATLLGSDRIFRGFYCSLDTGDACLCGLSSVRVWFCSLL